MRQRHGFYRAGLELHAAAGGPVRLGQHQGDVVSGGDQGLQRGGREFRRTGEDQTHLHGLAQAFFQLLFDAGLLQARQVLDEHLAFQVVHFVLDAYAKQPFGIERDLFSFAI